MLNRKATKSIEQNYKPHSAFERGALEQVKDFLDDLTTSDLAKCNERNTTLRLLLNGATNWENYSLCGCALVYNEDIARRYCTPSEFKKYKGGKIGCGVDGTRWLKLQARGSRLAASIICRYAVYEEAKHE